MSRADVTHFARIERAPAKKATPSQQSAALPTIESARIIGAGSASTWISGDEGLQALIKLPAWRAEMCAEFVGIHEGYANFMELLSAWEQGFDSTLNASLVPATAPGATPDAIHQPFSWLPASLKGDKHAEFLALTKTICAGVATCLELVQKNRMAEDNDDTPILNMNDAEALMMLASASAQMLYESADDHIDKLTDRAMKAIPA